MNVTFILAGNAAYRWHQHSQIQFIGYFFDVEGKLYRDQAAVRYLAQQREKNSAESLFANLDGCFSAIINDKENITIVSDAVNYFPVFYTFKKDELVISDSWDALVQYIGSLCFNEIAADEYLNAGFVLGDETLHSKIFKTNAGEILNFDGRQVSRTYYQQFVNLNYKKADFNQLAREGEAQLLRCGKQLITFLNGRTALVPLSGGYDSRLIVSLLKRLDYKEVICFTYGRYNSEVPISKSVAAGLDYEWHFVDYTKLNVPATEATPHYQQYLDFAANGFAMPYLMEYYAVQQLHHEGVIPSDAVFLPGHSGDFLGGSYILKTVKNNVKKENLPAHLERKYFILNRKSKYTQRRLRSRIKESLRAYDFLHDKSGYNRVVEEWDIREKLAKVIFNSSHVFNYFGYEHYFPLWSSGLRDFYSRIPPQLRENKKLYDFVAEEYFFKPFNVSFNKAELKSSPLQVSFQQLKDTVRYFFPWSLVLRRINAADWPYYQHLAQSMLASVESDQGRPFKNFKMYNAVVCAWYLQHIQDKYSANKTN